MLVHQAREFYAHNSNLHQKTPHFKSVYIYLSSKNIIPISILLISCVSSICAGGKRAIITHTCIQPNAQKLRALTQTLIEIATQTITKETLIAVQKKLNKLNPKQDLNDQDLAIYISQLYESVHQTERSSNTIMKEAITQAMQESLQKALNNDTTLMRYNIKQLQEICSILIGISQKSITCTQLETIQQKLDELTEIRDLDDTELQMYQDNIYKLVSKKESITIDMLKGKVTKSLKTRALASIMIMDQNAGIKRTYDHVSLT